jgi:hypothetical protein
MNIKAMIGAEIITERLIMVLFAIPLVAIKRFGVRAPLWLRLAAVSGFVVSVVAGFFTLIPITRVDSPLGFALKIIVVVVRCKRDWSCALSAAQAVC